MNVYLEIILFQIPEFGCEGDVAREATRTKEFSFNYIFWSVDQDDSNYCSQEKVNYKFDFDIFLGWIWWQRERVWRRRR